MKNFAPKFGALLARLRAEQSPETRKAILEEIRAKSLARARRFTGQNAEVSGERASLAGLKRAAAGNAELQERIARKLSVARPHLMKFGV